MATCKDCLHYGICEYSTIADKEIKCKDYICKTDYVKVVRCKDCKYMSNDGACNKCFKGIYSIAGYNAVHLYDFCSYGERD
jgi:hypothetical protein